MEELYLPLNLQRFATHLQTWGTYYRISGSGNPATNHGFDANGQIAVYLESQNIANNTSYIRIDHRIKISRHNSADDDDSAFVECTSSYRANQGSQGGNYQSKTGSGGYNGNGTTSERIINLGSTYHTVTHSADGTGTLYVNGTAKIYIHTIYKNKPTTFATGTRASSFNVALPTIPRATSISSFTLTNATINSLKVNWGTAHTVNRVQYQIGSGAWTTGYTGSAKSGSFTISSLSPNTTYSIKIRVRRADSGVETTSSAKSLKTLDIARITLAPDNIDIESDWTVSYSRNGATTTEFSIHDTAGSKSFYGYKTGTGTSYTYSLNSTERNNIYADMKTVNAKQYRMYLRTNSGVGYDYAQRTFKIVDANPIFNDFAYENTNKLLPSGINERTLTGSPIKFIKGYSDLKATITGDNLATAQKGADIKDYKLDIQGMTTITQTASNNVELIKENITNQSATVRAIDTRENLTSVNKVFDFINYTPLSISSFTVERQDGGVGENVKLNLGGTYCDCDFGVVNNDIEIEYYYRLPGTSYWQDISSDFYLDVYYAQPEGVGIPVNKNEATDYFMVGDYGKIEFTIIATGQNIVGEFPVILIAGLQTPVFDMGNYINYFIGHDVLITKISNNTAWEKGTTTITPTKSNGNFTVNNLTINGDVVDGFTVGQSFGVKVLIKDKVMFSEAHLILDSGTPNLALHKDGTAIGGMYDTALDNGIQLYGDNIYANGIPLIEWEEI